MRLDRSARSEAAQPHQIRDGLRRLAGRSTRQKRATWETLASVEDFISAKRLHRYLEDSGEEVSLATVYRILRAQYEAGTLDAMLRPEDGETLYRLCRTVGQHHHLICRDCGLVVEFCAPDLDRQAHATAESAGFSRAGLTFDLFGRCSQCSPDPQPP